MSGWAYITLNLLAFLSVLIIYGYLHFAENSQCDFVWDLCLGLILKGYSSEDFSNSVDKGTSQSVILGSFRIITLLVDGSESVLGSTLLVGLLLHIKEV